MSEKFNSRRQAGRLRFSALPSALPAALLLLLLLLAALQSRAVQAADYSRLDRHADNAPKRVQNSVEALTDWLVKPARSEEEKARVIYRWIARNITYDAPALFSGNLRDTALAPHMVLKRRLAVCDGYSELFKAMASRAGLKVEKVVGNARVPSEFINLDGLGWTNHAWNVVKIGGSWRLLDVTWGAGSVGPVPGSPQPGFVRRFEPFFFLTPAERFIYNHFPDDERWQLLKKPLSREQYLAQPVVSPTYFEHGLKTVSHAQGSIRAGEEVQIELASNPGVELLAGMQGDREQFTDGFILVRPGSVRGRHLVQALFPAPGKYSLVVYSKPDAQTREYTNSLHYTVQASQGTQRRYPQYHPAFWKHGLALESHPNGEIPLDSEAEITLGAPRDVALLVGVYQGEKKLPDNLLRQSRQGDRVSLSVLAPGRGRYQLKIFSRRGESSRHYELALAYTLVSGGGAGRVFPEYHEAFGQHGLAAISHTEGVISLESEVRITLGAPRQVELHPVLSRGREELSSQHVWQERTRDGISLIVRTPAKGTYKLKIFSRQGSQGQYSLALSYILEASAGLDGRAEFPVAYAGYNSLGARLEGPLTRILKAGEPVRFSISIPGAQTAMVQHPGGQLKLERSGETFSGSLSPAPGKLTVFAGGSGPEGLQGVLGYEARPN
ncbi:MAG: hypothetical protein OEZ59_05840 [Deltaproteobacteria bacterium]|nr:hypothetical protein [Deltaproteobacteria bacterium]